MEFPGNYLYTNYHHWVAVDAENGIVTVGITSYEASQLGTATEVQLPPVGQVFDAGEVAGSINSDYTTIDIYAPCTGEVIDSNQALYDNPQWVSNDPFGEGWLFIMRYFDDMDFENLLTADGYRELIDSDYTE
jgi:glycine cleavage system H protein